MRTLIKLPAEFAERVAGFHDGSKEPAEPRNASTVVLTRDGAEGPEVYLLRRQASMEFAAGMYVFPGGGVDSRDFDQTIGWAGPSPQEWAESLGTDENTARALVCAAVRETFEESGVLLAGESADTVVADTTGADWEADRQSLEAGDLSLSEFLHRRGLVLRTDLLGAWTAWLTPVFEPRRYRTWFFVAELPEGQVTQGVSIEADHATWLPALEAAERWERREAMMLPPTFLTCLDVARYPDSEAVIAASAGRRLEMFCPELIEAPDHEGYTLTTPEYSWDLIDSRGDVSRWGWT